MKYLAGVFLILFSGGVFGETYSSVEKIGSLSILLSSEDKETFSNAHTPQGLEQLSQILENFSLFLEETENLRVIPGPLSFNIKKSTGKLFEGSEIAIGKELHPEEIFWIKSLSFKEVKLQKNLLEKMVLVKKYSGTEELLSFDLYNLLRDEKGRIVRRMTLKHISGFSDPGENLQKFMEGTLAEYKYGETHQAESYLIQSFILGRRGEKIINLSREGLGRVYDSQGKLTQESIRETRYSYNLSPNRFAFYNVVFQREGYIESYDSIPSTPETGGDQEVSGDCMNARFENYQGGVPLMELKRRYHLEKGKKIFENGYLIQTGLDEDLKHVFSREQKEFRILPGKTGLAEEDREYIRGLYIFNQINKGEEHPREKLFVETYYGEKKITGATSEFLKNVKQIHYQYNPGKILRNMSIHYLIPGKEGVLIPVRILRAEILEFLPSGEPKQLQLCIENVPGKTELKEIFLQDCGYMLDEMQYGELFAPPRDSSETGEIPYTGEMKKFLMDSKF